MLRCAYDSTIPVLEITTRTFTLALYENLIREWRVNRRDFIEEILLGLFRIYDSCLFVSFLSGARTGAGLSPRGSYEKWSHYDWQEAESLSRRATGTHSGKLWVWVGLKLREIHRTKLKAQRHSW